MLILMPTTRIQGCIYRIPECYDVDAIHNYVNVYGAPDRFNVREYAKEVKERLKPIVEDGMKRLVKFSITRPNAHPVVFLERFRANEKLLDVFVKEDGTIVFSTTDNARPVVVSKTLAGTSTSSFDAATIEDVIHGKYSGFEFIAYEILTDKITILPVQGTRLSINKTELLAKINSFITIHCNKTLRVAVDVEDNIEIMEINI